MILNMLEDLKVERVLFDVKSRIIDQKFGAGMNVNICDEYM